MSVEHSIKVEQGANTEDVAADGETSATLLGDDTVEAAPGWATEVWPYVSDEFDKLGKQKPLTKD